MTQAKKSPHILIISAFDPLPGEGRELIRYPVLAKQLVAQGAQVTYLTSDFDHFSKQKRVPGKEIPDFKIHYLPTPPYAKNIGLQRPWNHLQLAKQLILWLDKNQFEGDAILSAWPPMQANFQLANWAKSRQIPFFLDIQDAWPEAFSIRIPAWIWRIFFTQHVRKRRKTIAAARAVLAVSQDYLNLLKVPAQQGKLFHLGAYFPEKREFEAVSNEKFKLILLAGSDRLPFLPKLIEKLHSRKEVELMLVGRSKAFQAVPTSKAVSVHYDVDKREKHHLLTQADVGLVFNDPKLLSRMPNKIFSYLSYGMPMLSNLKGGELESLLLQQKWGRACQADLSDIDAQLDDILKENLIAEKERIFSEAKQLFDKKQIYKAYAAFILSQIS